MTTATTERFPILLKKDEKQIYAKRAKNANLSMGEFFRRAADSYNPNQDDKLLDGMIDQMLKTTEQANLALDHAISFVEASNKRIDKMLEESKGI